MSLVPQILHLNETGILVVSITAAPLERRLTVEPTLRKLAQVILGPRGAQYIARFVDGEAGASPLTFKLQTLADSLRSRIYFWERQFKLPPIAERPVLLALAQEPHR